MAPLVSLTDVTGTIVLDWVKLADDGSDDLIVRLYEAPAAMPRPHYALTPLSPMPRPACRR